MWRFVVKTLLTIKCNNKALWGWGGINVLWRFAKTVKQKLLFGDSIFEGIVDNTFFVNRVIGHVFLHFTPRQYFYRFCGIITISGDSIFLEICGY